MMSVSSIFAIHKRVSLSGRHGKLGLKNTSFRQVVSMEKSTFAISEKRLDQGSER